MDRKPVLLQTVCNLPHPAHLSSRPPREVDAAAHAGYPPLGNHVYSHKSIPVPCTAGLELPRKHLHRSKCVLEILQYLQRHSRLLAGLVALYGRVESAGCDEAQGYGSRMLCDSDSVSFFSPGSRLHELS
jgi:hypothetical protein